MSNLKISELAEVTVPGVDDLFAIVSSSATKKIKKSNILRWDDWTPTITQSGSVTFTNAYARYCVIGRLARVQGFLLITGSGSAGNAIVLGGLPAAIAGLQVGAWRICGTFAYLDAGTTNYCGAVEHTSTTTLQFQPAGESGFLGVSPSFAAANTDRLGFDCSWEI